MSGLGPSISEDEREAALKRRREEQRRQQDESSARQVATSAATQQGTAAPGYWDMLGDPDIDAPAWSDQLEPFVKGELSRAFALGNITRKEFHDMQLRIENEFFQIQNEMKGPNTSITDDNMRLLYGEDRPELDDSEARRLRSAREIKQMLVSLGVDARGLRSGTEIHAVARTEDGNGEHEDGGLFSGARDYLSR